MTKQLAKDFVLDKLKDFEKKYQGILFKYQLEYFDDTHFIVCQLPDDFSFKKEYLKDESQMNQEFIERYPYQGLAFVEEDEIFKITNPLYETTPKNEIPIKFKKIKKNPIWSPQIDSTNSPEYVLNNSNIEFGHKRSLTYFVNQM